MSDAAVRDSASRDHLIQVARRTLKRVRRVNVRNGGQLRASSRVDGGQAGFMTDPDARAIRFTMSKTVNGTAAVCVDSALVDEASVLSLLTFSFAVKMPKLFE